MDSFVAKYKYHMKSRQWYMYLLWHTVTLGLINAWLAYRRDCVQFKIPKKTMLNHRLFKAQVATSLINVNVAKKRGRPSGAEEPTPPRQPKQMRVEPTADARKDQFAHWPIKGPQRGRCSVCKKPATHIL